MVFIYLFMIWIIISIIRSQVGIFGWKKSFTRTKDKILSWGESIKRIPIIGKLLYLAYKSIAKLVVAMKDTLIWITKFPVLCTIFAMARKLVRMLVNKITGIWGRAVEWSKKDM